MLLEEGMGNVWSRHEVFAKAVWAAIDAWGAGGEFKCNVENPAMRSRAVTMVKTSTDVGTELQAFCLERYGVVLGVALASDANRTFVTDAFRIGHMGHLNPSMLLGTLGAIEAGLGALDVKRGEGAVEAAARVIASV